MAKPVRSRTKSALARSIVSPRRFAIAGSCTRFVPQVTTSTGRLLTLVRKTSALAMCPTAQPMAAASAAVRVDASNSTTSKRGPSKRWTRSTLGCVAGFTGSVLVAGVQRGSLAASILAVRPAPKVCQSARRSSLSDRVRSPSHSADRQTTCTCSQAIE